MGDLRSDLLPVFSEVRGIADELGLRQYRVYLRVTTWSGDRVGKGTPTRHETELTVDGARPKVKLVTTREIISSGGKFVDVDYKVGPFTPSYTKPDSTQGGYLPSDLDPLPVPGVPTEVSYRIVGNGLDSYASKIEGHFDGNFGYSLVLRLQNTRAS
jgi:hypothetical protein